MIPPFMISNDIWTDESDMPSGYILGSYFEDFIKNLVESGRYNTASEVLRDGLCLLEERERLREIKIAELRRLAEEGRMSGLSKKAGKPFWPGYGANMRQWPKSKSGIVNGLMADAPRGV